MKPPGRGRNRFQRRRMQEIVNHGFWLSLAVRRAGVWEVEVKDRDAPLCSAAKVFHFTIDVRPNKDNFQSQFLCEEFYEYEKFFDKLVFDPMAGLVMFSMETGEQHLFTRSFWGGLQHHISGFLKKGELRPSLLIQNHPSLLVNVEHFKPVHVDEDADWVSLADVNLGQGELTARDVVVHLLLHLLQVLVSESVLSENYIWMDFRHPLANYLQHLKIKTASEVSGSNQLQHLRRPRSLPTVHFSAAAMPKIHTESRHCFPQPHGSDSTISQLIQLKKQENKREVMALSISPLFCAKPHLDWYTEYVNTTLL